MSEANTGEAGVMVDVLRRKLRTVDDTLAEGGISDFRAGLEEAGYQTLLGAVLDLAEENKQLRERVTELEARVTPDPERLDYDDMTREQRTHAVRVLAARRAESNGGKARIDYNDVLARFNQHPSRGYAYTLLECAANADGFEYGDHGGNKSLQVNLADVKDNAVFHAANTSDGRKGVNN